MKLFRCSSDDRWGSPMSNEATNLISLDGDRGPGTYAAALLLQSHQKEAAARSAKFLTYGWSTNENVICSKTTQGILESLINPNTMEVIHYWPSPQPWREGTAPREGRLSHGELVWEDCTSR